jgi:hypothetical protein
MESNGLSPRQAKLLRFCIVSPPFILIAGIALMVIVHLAGW